MTDFNILNRAVFDDKQIRHEIQMPPHLYEQEHTLEIGKGNVYWIRSIRWKFGYFDVGLPTARRIELKPIKVSVGSGTTSILKNDTQPYPNFVQPKPVSDKIEFRVVNENLGNNHALKVEFYLDGVLVSPKPGQSLLTYKEMLGYIMLGADKKGELAMHEASVDLLDEKMKELGIPSIREQLPMGLGGLAGLPNSLKALMLNKGSTMDPSLALALGLDKSSEQPKVLSLPYDKDGKKDRSSFIGDLMFACPSNCKEFLTQENLQIITDYMIDQGWRKISN